MDVTTLTQLDPPAKINAASTHHIHALPVELLDSIFLFLYRDQSIPRTTDDLRNTHKLAFIMLVCKDWKNAVECSPALWTDIWLDRGPKHVDAKDGWVGSLETLFKRSRTMPLDLTILVSLIDLEYASPILLQHLPRCETLVIQLQQPKGQIDCMTPRRLKACAVHRILSCPFPILQNMAIGGYSPLYEWDQQGPLLLDAPNLRSLSSSTYRIIPFVKSHGSPPAHDSLECFSINGGWQNVMEKLPLATISLPKLKSLSLEDTDDLWDILQKLDTPNLESLIVGCGPADWSEEVDSPTSVLRNLHELTWYTDWDTTNETPNLRHLLQHCPNIEYFKYNCYTGSAPDQEEYLLPEEADNLVLALSESLDETYNSSPRFCPRLRHLHLACASFEQVRDLVLMRPALEYVGLQCRKPGQVVIRSKTVWREKVDLVRWIRSKVEFEFETDGVAVGLDLQGEEGVFWNPGEVF
ncbi:hypothetical protein FRC00_001829 [Tulasnella sp. 408]|nr:hypothetical protein FRC00_001829 [Tulasnella sp. 408]